MAIINHAHYVLPPCKANKSKHNLQIDYAWHSNCMKHRVLKSWHFELTYHHDYLSIDCWTNGGYRKTCSL